MNNILDANKKYLFIGCHLDDIEFGCGGIVHMLTEMGAEVHLLTVSSANKNAAGDLQLIRDRQESFNAGKALGIQQQMLHIGNCYGQVLDSMQQQLREELIQYSRTIQPDIVFYPAARDIHQDHGSLAANAFRIFRNGSCFGYELVRSTFDFNPQVYIEVAHKNLEAKKAAVMCYRSQLQQSAGYYFDERIVEGIARFRGGQSGVELAEAFECYRMVVKG